MGSLPDDRTLQAAELYAATFAGRTDAYARWSVQLEQHVSVYERIRNAEGEWIRGTHKPLTPQAVVEAFQTGIPLSGYILSPDSTTHLAVLDIDREDGFELGMKVLAHVRELGGVAYIEASRRGCHVWILLEQPLPGIVIRAGLRQLIVESGLPLCPGAGKKPVPNPKTNKPGCSGCGKPSTVVLPEHADPKIELRPGSDQLNNEESLGHAIRMATMPHQRTGKRSILLSSDGEKLPGRLVEMMPEIMYSSPAIIEDLAFRCPPPVLRDPPRGLQAPYADALETRTASEILINEWGTDPTKTMPGRAIICPAHDDHAPSLSIARDDQRVWCKTGGCELSNNGRGRGTHELHSLATERGRH